MLYIIYKHYSSKEIVENIYREKELFLSKLKDCKGQKDFCLDEKMFFDILKKINFDAISYKKTFPREKFIKLCSQKKLNSNYRLNDDSIYGVCVTTDGQSAEFYDKYGDKYISFDIDAINRKNTGFLFVFDVVYGVEGIEQYLYDLSLILYNRGEYITRQGLDMDEKELPDNYSNMISRLYHFLKLLYKPIDFCFEKETRIIVDATILENGVVESFEHNGFYFTYNISEKIYEKHIYFENNKYILKLDSFDKLNLTKNL